MVTKVVIRDNTKSPIRYIADLKNFANGKEYVFKPGVNIIVGENGCGKTTLMNLIRKYLMVDKNECSRGLLDNNVHDLFTSFLDRERIYDGIDVYADYSKNTFRLAHAGERMHNDEIFESRRTTAEFIEQKRASTGEGVVVALNSLFSYMFSREARLRFDYSQFEDCYPAYFGYVERHRVICDDEWTILMDEPDRNLSLENLSHIRGILSFHKPQTQIISVVHNPLLIYALSEKRDVNFVEMTQGYVKNIKKQIKDLVK